MPQLFGTPVPTKDELRVQTLVDQLREKLAWAVSSRRWTGLLRRVTLAKAIQGSNSIEGYRVTVGDALAAVDGEEPLDAESETWAAVVGYRNAMTYVLQLADDTHFAYETALIKGLHYAMTSYDLTKSPGRWRPGPIFVRNEATGERVYEGPDAELVADLMSELVAELNEPTTDPAMFRAAMAHLNLVMIHPFADGNGRMGRCLQSLVLARHGISAPVFCSIEEYLGRNTEAYYGVLAAVGAGSWQPERDARPWLRFCLTAHFVQAITLLRRSKELQRLWDALEDLLRKYGLPDRMLYALAETAQGFRMTNGRYRSLADVSQNLASRDLAALCAQGLLEAHGERRGRFYTATPATRAIRNQTREARTPIPSPFENEGQVSDAVQPVLFS